MREVIGKGRISRPRDAKDIQNGRLKGYCAGGAVEDPKRPKRKKGGKVGGAKPKANLGKRPRKAGGGFMGAGAGATQQAWAPPPAPAPTPGGGTGRFAGQTFKKGGDVKKKGAGGSIALYHGNRTDGRKLKQPQTNVDKSGPTPVKRAHGGAVKGKRGGNVNIIIQGGGDESKVQAAKQEGMKAGAMMVMQKLKGAAGPGGPGAPPPGAMGAGPPPGPGPAPGGMPMPMRAKGGRVRERDNPVLHQDQERTKVAGYKRRRSGGAV